MMNYQYDEEIVRQFVSKDKQEGLLFKLARADRKVEAVSALAHAILFDPQCMTRLPKKPKPDELYSLLKARGAGEKAYICTAYEHWHGQIISLRDALEEFVGDMGGTFIYCFEGQIGYYEADGWEGFFIIHRLEKVPKKKVVAKSGEMS